MTQQQGGQQTQQTQQIISRNIQQVMVGNQPMQIQLVDNNTWVKYEVQVQEPME